MKDIHKSPYAKRRAAYKKRSAAKAAAGTKSLTSVIKAISSAQALKQLETKYVIGGLPGNAFNSVINSSTELYSIIPRLQQNNATLTDYQRVGNNITPTSLLTDWHVQISSRSRTMNIKVYLYVLQPKIYRNFDAFKTSLAGQPFNFLRSGQATQVQGFNGFITDGDLAINQENFTLLKKYTFQLNTNVGLPNGDTTNGNSPNTSLSYKHIRYSYKCPKQFDYDPVIRQPGDIGDLPTNHAPFWCLGYAHIDGSEPDLANTDVVVSYTTKMFFKDA